MHVCVCLCLCMYLRTFTRAHTHAQCTSIRGIALSRPPIKTPNCKICWDYTQIKLVSNDIYNFITIGKIIGTPDKITNDSSTCFS